MHLDGLVMYVSATAAAGVVDSATRLHFRQRGDRVWARYDGGAVARGILVGRWIDGRLHFRYAQVEAGGVHGGSSVCDVLRLANGRTRIRERFQWTTRDGSGENVFDEVSQ